MTMPNGPGGITPGLEYAITGDPALGDTPAALPGRTQDVIEQEMKAKRLAHGNSVFSQPAGPFGKLAELLGMGGKGPFDALAHRLAQALLGEPADHAWPTFDDLLGSLGQIPQTLTEHTEAIANLNAISAAMQTTQAYVGDLQDIVTVPRWGLAVMGQGGTPVDVLMPQTIALGTVYTVRAIPIYYPARQAGATTGDIYYTPLVVDRYGIPGSIRWITGMESSLFSIDFYEMALCVYNPANGNVEKVWGSGNIKDGVAAAVDDMNEVQIDMHLTGQHVTPGQILFAAHQQTAAGLLQGSRAFAAVPAPGVGRPAGMLLDACCYVAPHHSRGIPSSIKFSALARENRFIPWAAVSITSEPDGR